MARTESCSTYHLVKGNKTPTQPLAMGEWIQTYLNFAIMSVSLILHCLNSVIQHNHRCICLYKYGILDTLRPKQHPDLCKCQLQAQRPCVTALCTGNVRYADYLCCQHHLFGSKSALICIIYTGKTCISLEWCWKTELTLQIIKCRQTQF